MAETPHAGHVTGPYQVAGADILNARTPVYTPATARVERNGEEAEVPLEQKRFGDEVVVRFGDRVPVHMSQVPPGDHRSGHDADTGTLRRRSGNAGDDLAQRVWGEVTENPGAQARVILSGGHPGSELLAHVTVRFVDAAGDPSLLSDVQAKISAPIQRERRQYVPRAISARSGERRRTTLIRLSLPHIRSG